MGGEKPGLSALPETPTSWTQQQLAKLLGVFNNDPRANQKRAGKIADVLSYITPLGVAEGLVAQYRDNMGHLRKGEPVDTFSTAGLAALPDVGMPAKAMFLGVRAMTAPLAKLRTAQAMEKAGVDRADIWTKQGWYRGVDGKWRWEISDKPAETQISEYEDAVVKQAALMQEKERLLKKGASISQAENFRNRLASFNARKPIPNEGSLVDTYLHPELHNAYDFSPVQTVRFNRKNMADIAGANTEAFAATTDIGGKQVPILGFKDYNAYRGLKKGPGDRGLMAHEVQHVIQNTENWAPGSNIALAGSADNYTRTAGEVEARNTQARLNMTEAERRKYAPWLTQDVTDDMQIVMPNQSAYRNRLKFAKGGRVSSLAVKRKAKK